MRWMAHHDRINELRNILGEDLFVISYESFAHDTKRTINELQKFLGLHRNIPIPDVKTESLQKWKSQLSSEEIKQIQNFVGLSPNASSHSETDVCNSYKSF